MILRKALPETSTIEERMAVVDTLRNELDGRVDARLDWDSAFQCERVARYGFQRAQGAQALRDVAQALQFLHIIGVVHCDLKPKNVLITLRQGCCWRQHLLGDFGKAYALAEGQACALVPDSSTARGSPTYRAPEVFPPGEGPGSVGERRLSRAADIFSFGTLAYDVLVSSGERTSVRWQLIDHFGDSECVLFVCVLQQRACALGAVGNGYQSCAV